MDSKFSLPLDRQNLAVLVLCIMIALVAGLVLLGPAVSRNRTLDQKIIAEQARLNILAQAALIQHQLDQHEALLASRRVPAAGRPEALPPEQSNRILVALHDLASSNAVKALAISPQLDDLDGDSKEMRIEASFLGSLPNLHALTTEILLLPYVGGLQTLNFAAEDDSLRLNVIFSILKELPENHPAPPVQGEPAS